MSSEIVERVYEMVNLSPKTVFAATRSLGIRIIGWDQSPDLGLKFPTLATWTHFRLAFLGTFKVTSIGGVRDVVDVIFYTTDRSTIESLLGELELTEQVVVIEAVRICLRGDREHDALCDFLTA